MDFVGYVDFVSQAYEAMFFIAFVFGVMSGRL